MNDTPYRGRPTDSHRRGGGGGGSSNKGCCSMAAAVKSAKDGNWRLARRYVRMTPLYLARRFA